MRLGVLSSKNYEESWIIPESPDLSSPEPEPVGVTQICGVPGGTPRKTGLVKSRSDAVSSY